MCFCVHTYLIYNYTWCSQSFSIRNCWWILINKTVNQLKLCWLTWKFFLSYCGYWEFFVAQVSCNNTQCLLIFIKINISGNCQIHHLKSVLPPQTRKKRKEKDPFYRGNLIITDNFVLYICISFIFPSARYQLVYWTETQIIYIMFV